MSKAVIHHYPAGAGQVIEHEVPPGTRILSAACRDGQPVVYVEKVTPGGWGRRQVLSAIFYGTGHQWDVDGSLAFIGTVNDGPLFWHVYGKIV